MATQNAQVPWDAQTDQFISDLDDITKVDNEISIRDLLLNPEKYLEKEGIDAKLMQVKSSVDNYFNEMLAGLGTEQKELESAFGALDISYSKIDSVISSKAATAHTPYIRPYFLDANRDTREEITVEQYSEDLDQLIGKLVNGASYAANLSGEYKGHKLGSWAFSGNKVYILTLKIPEGMVMDIERSSDLINGMLNAIADSIGTLKKANK